jgi:glycosyltransferase involved in cell wall biosynthesis
MKIAVLGPTYPIKGGISHYTTLLVENLRKKHDVTFLSMKYQYPAWLYPGTGQFDSSGKTIDIENDRIFHSLWLPSWNRIVKRVRDEKCDILLTAWWTFFFSFQFAHINSRLRKSGTKIMYICHNVKQHENRPLESFFTRLAFQDVNYFIVHSSEDRDNLLKYNPNAQVKINVHPTYDHFAKIYDSQRIAKLKMKKKPHTILFFGVVRPYKGLRYLVEAFPHVLNELPDANLLIVGDFWEKEEDYRKLIQQFGIESRTELINSYVPNEEVGDYFYLADCLALPYTSATQSGIVQISYGFGVPVVVTKVGGLPEVVQDGLTGVVVEKENPKELAKGIIRILRNTDNVDYRAHIGDYINRFSWDHMVETIESFFIPPGS